MTFLPERTNEFLEIFKKVRSAILATPGCLHLELLRDLKHKHVFFTYSHWKDAASLQAYRHSDLFSSTWGKTKECFLEPAEAWSFEMLDF